MKIGHVSATRTKSKKKQKPPMSLLHSKKGYGLQLALKQKYVLVRRKWTLNNIQG